MGRRNPKTTEAIFGKGHHPGYVASSLATGVYLVTSKQVEVFLQVGQMRQSLALNKEPVYSRRSDKKVLSCYVFLLFLLHNMFDSSFPRPSGWVCFLKAPSNT